MIQTSASYLPRRADRRRIFLRPFGPATTVHDSGADFLTQESATLSFVVLLFRAAASTWCRDSRHASDHELIASTQTMSPSRPAPSEGRVLHKDRTFTHSTRPCAVVDSSLRSRTLVHACRSVGRLRVAPGHARP